MFGGNGTIDYGVEARTLDAHRTRATHRGSVALDPQNLCTSLD